MLKFILTIFIIWRLNLEFLAWIGKKLFPLREGFLGPIPWANFDGVHYLSIAKNGYYQFQQAFFPLYPLLIRFLGKLLGGNLVLAGMLISNLSLLGALFLFWKLLETRQIKDKTKKWVIVFFLFFPTSFFFGSLYTESLFLVFVLGTFLASKEEKWWLAGILGALASATKLIGIFLLPALLWKWREQNKQNKNQRLKIWNLEFGIWDLFRNWKLEIRNLSAILLVFLGLLTYMFYLGKTVGDPLFFIHAQPAFGAERSGGQIILLPQVYWRYFKIFITVSWYNYDFWIALLEFVVFNFVLLLLWLGWRRKLPKSWLLFSLLVILGPTLTGSLSSMPRYVLIAFPIFIVMAGFNKMSKYLLFIIYYLLFSLLTILFTRGFFVS
ncbi:hypothetical protein ISS85_04475 [Candidatus Microgenomates bacterium]|nr:hypothetical protein [Candidatus Microgenomates bacterium]